MTKPRSDATLLNLPPDQQELICEWLLTGVEKDEGRDTSYKAVAGQVFLDLGVKTSETALRNFYRKVAAPRRLRTAAAAAEQVMEAAGAQGLAFSAAARALVKQKLFELTAEERPDPEELLAFGKLVADYDKGELAERKLTQKDEELRLAKHKYQRDTCRLFLAWVADEQAKQIAAGSGSQADKIEALGRAMFGEDWDEA